MAVLDSVGHGDRIHRKTVLFHVRFERAGREVGLACQAAQYMQTDVLGDAHAI